MSHSPFNPRGLNNPGQSLHNIIKTQENTINQLKLRIQAYEKNHTEQNQKLSKYDSLFIDYNSLSKNYSELEKELALSKNEIIQLKNMISSKNNTIAEYQNLFEASKKKFELFEKTNNELKIKIKELEGKLMNVPGLIQNNNDLNLKLNEYENKIKLIKDEFNKKEELYHIKLGNQEKIAKNNSLTYEEDIGQLNLEIRNLKNQLELHKHKNDEIISMRKNAENEFIMQLKMKDKEIEKLSKQLSDMKLNINNSMLSTKSDIMSKKNTIDKLKQDNIELIKVLEDRDAQISELNDALDQADLYIKQKETELININNTINSLMREKEVLIQKLNDKQIDFDEFCNSSEKEMNILHNKLAALQKEKNILINDNQNHRNEINQLQDDMNQYLKDDKLHFEECRQVDQKYNNLVKAYKMKENDYNENIAKLNIIINNLKVEMDLIKTKYEKKIQSLTLNNNELNVRCKNLINSLIALKDYALTIERNMNEVQNMRNNINGGNYSMIIRNNNNSFINDEFANTNNNNINLTYQGDFNEYTFDENNKKSRELLNSMKNMLNKIHTKFYENNTGLLE